MAETFQPFPDLPKELRLQIWEQAMIEARPDRRIIVYQLRVVPFKQSISPLLLVNHESRTCAKAFYNVKLDLHAIPPLSNQQIKSLDKKKHWKRIPGIKRAVDGKIHGYTDRWVRDKFYDERRDVLHRPFPPSGVDTEVREFLRVREEDCQKVNRKEKEYTVNLEEHWDSYVEDQLSVLGSESAAQADTSGLTKGALYISPEHDVFIEGYECGEHFFNIEDTSKIFGAKLEQRVTSHHISEILDAATRARVSTLVQVMTPEIYSPRHCVFVKGQLFINWHLRSMPDPGFGGWYKEHEWSLKTFPSVNYYFRLHTCRYDRPGFLKTLLDADGAELSPVVEQWVKTGAHLLEEGTESEGTESEGTLWEFEQTKGCYSFGSLELFDWTRDLMEHWDVGQAGAGPLRYQQLSNDEPRRAANPESPAGVLHRSRVGARRTFWGSLKRFWGTVTAKLMAQSD